MADAPHSDLIARIEASRENDCETTIEALENLLEECREALLSAQQQPPAHFSDNVDDAILSVVAWARDQTNRWEYDHAVKYLHSLAAQQQPPREPTPEMLDSVEGFFASAAHPKSDAREYRARMWRIMYDAAQQQQKGDTP